MKERPILFSGEMVHAILDGRKTQTRRIIKPQPPCLCVYAINGAGSHAICHAVDNPSVWVPPTARSKDHRLPCPYGSPGDRLWVKETSCEDAGDGQIRYRADPGNVEASSQDGKWVPSMFMRRTASRITLEITDVRVERLNDITTKDAVAEGVAYDVSQPDGGPVSRYKALWESINGKGSWALNPWVWAISFRRV